jgi:serine/threonine protein kinase/tetratricopeptide (TPR) repeat protein
MQRYEIKSKLNEGGMGAIYLAYDRLAGETVALKRVTMLPHLSSGGSTSSSMGTNNMRLALTREFNTLATLRHPNIISVLDYGFDYDDGAPFFTMEYLTSASDILSVAADLPFMQQIDLIVQMLQALSYLHRRGILHRDLKPANVLVRDHRVRVLDFGLSADQSEKSQTAGTINYMAPEVLMEQPLTAASDLYAVGVIAYEIFAGQHPFEREDAPFDVSKIIMRTLSETPAVDTLPVPLALQEVIGRLLAKSPHDRYEDANEASKALCEASNTPLPPESSDIRESFLQGARFVGRQAEMQQILDALDETMLADSKSILVGGVSGQGKSRLIEEVRVRALLKGVSVVRTQVNSEGSIAGQMWRPALRWMALEGDATDEEAAAFKLLVPDIEDLLGRPIPDLYQYDPDPNSPPSVAILSATRAILSRLHRPMMMIVEDAHWMSDMDLQVLRQLFTISKDQTMLWLVSYRNDERPDLPQQLADAQVIKLNPLNDNAVADLSASILGDAGKAPELVALLQRETEGNVFFLVEVIRALAEEAGDLTKIGTTTLPARLLTGGVERILARRISLVPSFARPLMDLAAMMGREVDVDVLRALHTDPSFSFDRWLFNSEESGLLTTLEDRWRFTHDKLREYIVSLIPADVQRQHHNSISMAMERVYADDLDNVAASLAHHCQECGELAKAARYLIRAGDVAFATFAGGTSIPYYERARALSARVSLSTDELIHLYKRLGRAYELTHQTNIAATLFSELQALGRARNDELMLFEGTMAHTLLISVPNQLADYPKAVQMLQEALPIAARLPNPDSKQARVHWNLLLALYFIGDLQQSVAHGRTAIELARQAQDMEVLSYALNDVGRSYQSLEMLREARAASDEARQLFRAQNNIPMLCDNLSGSANTYMTMGDLDEALALAREANELGRRTGNAWAQNTSLWAIGRIEVQRGHIDEMLAIFKQVEAAAHQTKALQFAFFFVAIARMNIAGALGDEAQFDHYHQIVNESLNTRKVPPNFRYAHLASFYYYSARMGRTAQIAQPLRAFLNGEAKTANVFAKVLLYAADGLCLLAEGKSSEALALIEQAYQNQQSKAELMGAQEVLFVKGKILRALNRPQEALAAYTEAHTSAERMAIRAGLWEIYAEKADLLAVIGDAAAATQARKQARAVVEYMLTRMGDAALEQHFRTVPLVAGLLADQALADA